MLPNFLIIGSQKAGTSTLYTVLAEHPEVFMPAKKELKFFFLDREYAKGLGYYETYFQGARAKAVGEASPGYICHPAGPFRIRQALPDAKLIVTVREPIARAYSQYWDNRRHLNEPRRFEDTLDIALTERYYPGILGYFARGTYALYLQDYLRHFPREQLHVVVFDDLVADPAGTCREVFEFLGVDPDFEPPSLGAKVNPTSTYDNPAYRWLFAHPEATRHLPGKVRTLLQSGPRVPFRKPPIEASVRARLETFYAPYNAALSELLGRDLGW